MKPSMRSEDRRKAEKNQNKLKIPGRNVRFRLVFYFMDTRISYTYCADPVFIQTDCIIYFRLMEIIFLFTQFYYLQISLFRSIIGLTKSFRHKNTVDISADIVYIMLVGEQVF